MTNWLSRISAILAAIYLIANSSWIHAASYSLLAKPCSDVLMEAAQARVADLYGGVTSQPIFACTENSNNWLHVQYGETNFAPGLPPAIRIGPAGMNVDVIAHEWAHAELFERVGFFKREFGIPTWFDEGLAMQVDQRNDYGLEALDNYNANTELTTPDRSLIGTSGFFSAGLQGKYHYALSRCLVATWRRANPIDQNAFGGVDTDGFELIYNSGIRGCGRAEAPLEPRPLETHASQ